MYVSTTWPHDNDKVKDFSFTDNTHRGIVQDKHIKRSRPRCLSMKVIKGELSITTDRRKTLVFFSKSQETCL